LTNDATCDGIDDDCDNETDEDYVPVDTSCGVGACAATGSSSCVAGVVQPNCTPGTGTAEVCNGIDDDCNGLIDDGLTFKTYYLDADNDTYGDADNATAACEAPAGYVTDNTDCDDADNLTNPDAKEVCGDFIDNDCDNTTSDSCCPSCCIDKDNDTYGDNCSAGPDCDDTDPSIHEGCPTCEVKIIPKQIFKLLAIINPIHPFIISAAKDSGVEFARPIEIDWGTEAINDLLKVRIGKRIILGVWLVRPLKLVAGDFDVTVTFGADNTICAGTITVK
jgi:hypothetical protein